MKPALKYYRPAILWALFVLVLCSVKLGEVSKSPLFFAGFDKLVHCGLLFVLTVLMAWGCARSQTPRLLPYNSLLVITVIAIAYGGLIEILQRYFFTWRSGEWDDLFADTVGILMATFSIFITAKALSK